MNDDDKAPPPKQHVILFYRYHALTGDAQLLEMYRLALETLCGQLGLVGRILVAAEGLNGTLAGIQPNVRAFTWALMGDRQALQTAMASSSSTNMQQSVDIFWNKSQEFFTTIHQPELRIQSPDDFKWSVCHDDKPLFPDLRIVIRKELIGAGLSDISLEETAQGYLTPAEWHQELQNTTDETVIIDCRNTKEYEIGRFEGALDPQTTTFAQFPQWVQHHKSVLENKRILMYCTGGIRCEKASAYIRRAVPNVAGVNHLKGGIHKYLETYGGSKDCLWHGKNFVFDGRQAVSAQETHWGKDRSAEAVSTVAPNNRHDDDVVGKCVYCQSPYDQFDANCVCAVCREPLLACIKCQSSHSEFHCRQHFHLRNCYFSSLERFDAQELEKQKELVEMYLAEIAVGRKFKQKRKTLVKQFQRITERLQELSNTNGSVAPCSNLTTCRNCGQEDCTGKCWGFFGLKRKEVLEADKSKSVTQGHKSMPAEWSEMLQKPKRQRQKEKEQLEIERLGFFHPCCTFRNAESGIRVPPCVTRVLKCHTKGKWCGRLVIDVVQEEFKELASPERLQESLRHGLLRLNDVPLEAFTVAQIKLKSSDVLSRAVHWHEAPVIVPETLGIDKFTLPDAVVEAFGLEPKDATVYVCDKPSTVPVHPAGPYFSNTLTFLVEAQLGLAPQSLNPIHRTDRVTSGLTLCCSNPNVARIFHRSLSEGSVRKMYVAKVKGKFPSSETELGTLNTGVLWLDKSGAVEIDAPVYTSDPANGIRIVSDKGKQSVSRFKLVHYDAVSDCSIIVCFPLTGRNHQLRLHLMWMGFPIMHDIQYGGAAMSKEADKSIEAMQSMRDALEMDSQENDTQARKACHVCSNQESGIRNSFTPAQLLKQGHSIMLHAYRYEVTFVKQRKEIASREYAVGLPDWVKPEWQDRLVWLED